MFQMTHFKQTTTYSSISNNMYYWYFVAIRTTFLLFVYLMRASGLWLTPKKVITDIESYENKVKPAFLKFAEFKDEEENKQRNRNIDPVFYKRKELAEMMKTENDIEKQWKSRILIEFTPRDNIIMFYDAYKGGFAYYCDHSVVPNRILNAMAMKYVMRYYCLDFFVDEIALQGNSSPLISLLNEEDKEDTHKIKKLFNNLSKNTNVEMDKLPFLKPKNGGKMSVASGGMIGRENDKNRKEGSVELKEKRINKFIHLGKFNNYAIIQKKTKMHIPALNKNTDSEYGFKNVNYDEYKKRLTK
jgi:hypothetical protein